MVYGSVCHRLKLAFTLFISFSSWKLVFPLMMYKKKVRRINVVAKKSHSVSNIIWNTHVCMNHSSFSLSSVFDTDWWSHFPMKCSHHSKSTNLICGHGHGRLINNPILLARNGCHVDIDVWIWWTERGLRVTYYLYPT